MIDRVGQTDQEHALEIVVRVPCRVRPVRRHRHLNSIGDIPCGLECCQASADVCRLARPLLFDVMNKQLIGFVEPFVGCERRETNG
jgi:hypothetical protein